MTVLVKSADNSGSGEPGQSENRESGIENQPYGLGRSVGFKAASTGVPALSSVGFLIGTVSAYDRSIGATYRRGKSWRMYFSSVTIVGPYPLWYMKYSRSYPILPASW